MSILALAACASGGSPDGRFTVTSTSRYAYVSDEAAQNNKKVTSMDSEVIVCGNDGCPAHMNRYIGSPSHHRAASSVQGEEGSYQVYDLKNVSFTMADEGFDPGEESFTFLVSDGKDGNPRGQIIGIDMGDRQFNLSEDDFLGKITVTGDEQKDGKLEYNSVALRDKIGLRYSDFGNAKVYVKYDDKMYTPEQRFVFLGGYDAKEIKDKTKINSDLTFSGQATGSVVAVLLGEGSGHNLDLDTIKNTDKERQTAKLRFVIDENDNSKVDTLLTAYFDNWYDVEYTEKSTGEKTISFSNFVDTPILDDNGERIKDNENNNLTYRMLQDDGTGNFTISDNKANIQSDIRYYGGDKPVEAVGLIQVRDCNGNTCNNDYGDANNPKPEVRMNLGFGVTVDNSNTNN